MKSFQVKNNIGNIVDPNNRNIFNKYLNDVAKFKPLSNEEELELYKKIKRTNSQALKDKLCKHNLLFVISVAKSYGPLITKSMLTLEDLISEGNVGLYTAIDKFDYTRGIKFISFAIWDIRGSILKCIGDNIKSVRTPLNIQQKTRNLLIEEKKLQQEMGCEISNQELFNEAKRMGILSNTDDITLMNDLLNNRKDKSISDLLTDGAYSTFSDTIECDEPSPSEQSENIEFENNVHKLLKRVPIQEKNYIIDHFGLNGEEPMNLKELGRKYKTLPATIRFRMDKQLRRIRSRNRSNRQYFRENM